MAREKALDDFPDVAAWDVGGVYLAVQTFGWSGGSALVGLGTQEPGDIGRLTSLVSLTALPAAASLVLPETRRRELETISVER